MDRCWGVLQLAIHSFGCREGQLTDFFEASWFLVGDWVPFPRSIPSFGAFTPLVFAHNDYAQLPVETGWIGFGLMAWFLICLYRRALPPSRHRSIHSSADATAFLWNGLARRQHRRLRMRSGLSGSFRQVFIEQLGNTMLSMSVLSNR
jgi:hypothetical protein